MGQVKNEKARDEVYGKKAKNYFRSHFCFNYRYFNSKFVFCHPIIYKKEPIIPEKKITEKAKEPTDDKQQLVTQAKIWLKATIMTKRLRYWKKIVRTDLLKHNSFFKH